MLAVYMASSLSSCASSSSINATSSAEYGGGLAAVSSKPAETRSGSSSSSERRSVPGPTSSSGVSESYGSPQTPGQSAKVPSNLSNAKIVYWQPATNKEHITPTLGPKFKTLLDRYDGYHVGESSSKVLYLTFDEGYENGFTPTILDTLKRKGTTAAFFVTRPYIKSNPELIRRMVNEGHIVGNHTSTHPSMPDKSNEQLVNEIESTATLFKEVTGKDMPGFFRPPKGEWSERTLYITKSLGYKTILWSMAYKDYDTKNQPGKQAAINFVNTYYHNGAIILLHAVSSGNDAALGEIIEGMEGRGYRFAPLTELYRAQ